MSTRIKFGKSALAFLALLIVILGGCDNFMSNDTTLKDNLTEEVRIANAPELQVRVQAASGTGTTSPNGYITTKTGVSFSLIMVCDTDYGFIRWAAYSTSDTATELGGDIVTFASVKSPETTAILNVERNDILIQPVCEKRPKVTATKPASGETGVARNVPIKIYFSKRIDPASFTFDDGSMRKDGLFKNISIMSYVGSNEQTPAEQYYQDPVLDSTGKVLTLKPAATRIDDYSNTAIEISKSIVDSSGLTMADSSPFSFRVSNVDDQTAPTVVGVYVCKDKSNLSKLADDDASLATRRTNLSKVYVYALDVSDDSSLESLMIHERRRFSMTGAAVNAEEFTSKIYGAGSDGDYYLDYTLQSPGDGLIEISVVATDASGNTNAAWGPTNTYVFVRDVTAPDTTANIGKLSISGQATTGWFNAESPDVTFTPAGLVDSGGSPTYNGSPVSLSSTTVQYSAGFDSADTVNSTDWQSGQKKNFPIPAGTPDGASIPVYFKLRDDLGNTSSVAQLATVKKDVTPPALSSVSVPSAKHIGSIYTIGSASFGINLTGTDAMSGISYYYLGETPAATGWNPVSTPGQSLNETYTFSGSGETFHTVNAWIKDAAGNVSPMGSTTVFMDTVKPTVSKFILTAATDYSAKTHEEDITTTTQYAKTTTFYFAFVASDATTGIGSFGFADSTEPAEPAVTSFDISSPGQADWPSLSSGGYTVTNVHRANLSGEDLPNSLGKSQVLVTGKLTVPAATLGQRSIRLKVADRAGNIMDTSISSDNVIIFDNMPPLAPTVALKQDGSHKFHTDEKSDILYTNDPTNHTITVTASDTAGTRISGINYATASGDLLDLNSVNTLSNIAFDKPLETESGSVDSGKFSFSPTYGTKTLTVKAYDNAGNVSPATTFTTVVDDRSPNVILGIRSSSTGSNLIEKAAGDTSKILGNDVKTYKALSAPYLYVGSNDDKGIPNAGVKIATYPFTVTRQRPVAGSAVTPLTGTVTLDETTGAAIVQIPGSPFTQSGQYIVSLKLKDNLDNETDEQKIGFVYDNTQPTVPTLKVVDSTGSAIGVLKDGNTFIKTGTFYLQGYSTDRPSGADPDGSGITTVHANVAIDGAAAFTDRSYTAGTGVTISGSATTAVTETNDAAIPIWILNNDGSLKWPWTITKDMKCYVTVEDAMGNAQSSANQPVLGNADNSVHVVLDTLAPSASGISVDMGTNNLQSGGIWYGATGASNMAVTTVIDNGESSIKSDAYAWALGTSPTAPNSAGVPVYGSAGYDDNWATPSGAWHHFIKDPTTWSVALHSLLLGQSAPVNVYLFLMDYAGNVSSAINIDASNTYKFKEDKIAPAITDLMAAPAGGGSYLVKGGYTFIKGTDNLVLRAKASDRYASTDQYGSGIKNINVTFSYSNDGSTAIPPSVRNYEAGSPVSDLSNLLAVTDDNVDGHYITIYNAEASNPIYSHWGKQKAFFFTVTATDYVGKAASTSQLKVVSDSTPPVITSTVDASGSVLVNGVNYCKSYPGFTSLSVADTAADATYQPASGVKAWILTTSATAPTDTTPVYNADPTSYTTNWTAYNTSGVTPLWHRTDADVPTFTAATVGGAWAGMLSTTAATHVYLYAVDFNGNVSAYSDLGSFQKDDIAPTPTVTTPVTHYQGAGGAYFVNATDASSKVNFSATDNASRVKKYYLSTSSTWNGANVVNTVSSFTDDGTGTGPISVNVSSYLTSSTKLYVYFEDTVGNISVGTEVTHGQAVKLDSTGPAVTSVTLMDPDNDGFTLYTNHDYVSMKVAYNADTTDGTAGNAGSGISKIVISGAGLGVTAATAANVTVQHGTRNGDLYTGITRTYNSGTGELTIELSEPVTTSGTFYIKNLTIAGTTPSMTVKLIDCATNVGVEGTDDILTDKDPPTLGTMAVKDSSTNSASYTKTGDLTITIQIKETGSGIAKVVFGNTVASIAASPTVYWGDSASTTNSAGTCTGSGSTLTISTPVTSGTGWYYLVIRGIQLSTTEGEQTITATVYDGGNNSKATATNPKIIYDTIAPAGLAVSAYPSSFQKDATTYYYKGSAGIDFKFSATDTNSLLKGFSKTNDASDTTAPTAAINYKTSGTVYAFDNAGNGASLTLVVTADNAAPTDLTVTPNAASYPMTVSSGASATYFTKGDDITFTPAASDSSADDSGLAGYSIDGSATVGSGLAIGTTNMKLNAGATTNVKAIDKVGNPSTALAVTVTKDIVGPTPTITVDKTASSGNGIFCDNANSRYFTNGAKLSFTMTDEGCGSASYIVSTAATSSAISSSNSLTSDWQTLSAGTNISTASSGDIYFTSLLETTTAKPVYLYTKDNLGNIEQKSITFNDKTYNSWIKDVDGPTVMTADPDATSGVYPLASQTLSTTALTTFYTSGADVSLTMGTTESGSGIASYVATYNVTSKKNSSGSTLVLPQTGAEYSVVATDNVGNASAAYRVKVTADSTPPDVPTLTATGGKTGSGSTTTSSTSLTTFYAQSGNVSFTFSGGSDSGCGPKGYSLSDSTFSSVTGTSVNPGTGTVTVYAWDNVDNKSAGVPVKVVYDTAKPGSLAATATAGGGSVYPSVKTTLSAVSGSPTVFWTTLTSADTVTLDMSSDEAVSGVNSWNAVCANNAYDASGATSLVLRVGQSYTITATDNAGNISAPVYVSIISDTDAPTGLTLTATDSKYTASGSSVASDTGSTTYFYTNVSGGSVAFTANATETGCPIRGYSTSNSSFAAFSGSVTASSGTVTTVYAWDYLGHFSDGIPVSVAYDNSAPGTITAVPVSTTGAYPTSVATLSTDSGAPTKFWTKPAAGSPRKFTMSASATGSGIASYKAVCTTDSGITATGTDSLDLQVGYTYKISVLDYATNESGFYYLSLAEDNAGPTGLTLTADTGATSGGDTTTTSVSETEFFIRTSDDHITFTASGAGDGSGSGLKGYSLSNSTYSSITSTDVKPSNGTVTVYAWDNLGNTKGVPVKVMYDDVVPSTLKGTVTGVTVYPAAQTTLSTNSGNPTNFFTTLTSGTVSLGMAATESGGSGLGLYTATCTAGGGSNVTSASPLVLTVGCKYTITVKDHAGNPSSATYVSVVSDADAPASLMATATASAGGIYPTAATSLASTTSGSPQVFYTTGSSITLSMSATEVSGVASYTAADATSITGSTLVFPAGTTAYAITATDNLSHESSPVYIKVVQDTDRPATPEVISASGASIYPSESLSAADRTYWTSGSSIDFTPSGGEDVTGGSGQATWYATYNAGANRIDLVSGKLTLPVGQTYSVYSIDNVNNFSETPRMITVTQDNTGPTISTTSWSANTTLEAASLASDSGSDIATVSIDGTSYTTGPSAVLWSLGAGQKTVVATDNVGNLTKIYVYLTSSGTVTLRINMPSSWTATTVAENNITVSGIGLTADTKGVYKDSDYSTKDNAVTFDNDSIRQLSTGIHYLKISDSESTPNSVTFNFNVIEGSASVLSIVALGNPIIGTRLVDTLVAEQDALPIASALGNRDNALASWRAVSPTVRAKQLAERAAAKQAAAKAEEKERAESAAKSAATVTPLEKLHGLALARAQTGLTAPAVKAETPAKVAKPVAMDKPEVLENRVETMRAIFLPLATKYLSSHGVVFDGAHNGGSSTNALPNRTGAEMGLLDSREPYCLQRRCKVARKNG